MKRTKYEEKEAGIKEEAMHLKLLTETDNLEYSYIGFKWEINTAIRLKKNRSCWVERERNDWE